jgi:hypothetical protein
MTVPAQVEVETRSEHRFWSVTTLINAGLGKGEGLVTWAAKQTAYRAFDRIGTLQAYVNEGDRDGAMRWLIDARWDTLKSAGVRGTKVHRLMEQYALGVTEPEVHDDFLPYDVQLRKFLSEWRPVIEMAEAPVYNPNYSYAGTLDIICRFPHINEKRYVLDAKTTDKAPPEIDPEVKSRPPYPEISLQTCAYSRCPLVGVSPAIKRNYSGRRYYVYDPDALYEPMPPIDGGLALILSPYDYTLTPVRIDDEVWQFFGHVREAARWQLRVSQRVLGLPLPPPQETS